MNRLAHSGDRPLQDAEWDQVKTVGYSAKEPILGADRAYQALLELRGVTLGQRRREPLYTDAEIERAEGESRNRATKHLDYVEAIRGSRKIFGNTVLPFASHRAVADWIAHRLRRGDGSRHDDLVKLWLHFVGPGPPDGAWSNCHVRPDSSLGTLQRSIATLAVWLNCEEAPAADYILTGEVPIVMPITAWVSDTIKIGISYPWVRPDSLRKFYAWARVVRGTIPGLPLDTGVRTQALVDFVKRTEGQEQSQRFAMWNKAHPEWLYASVDSFRAAVSSAQRRKRVR